MAKSRNDILWRFIGDSKSLDRASKKAQGSLKETERASGRLSGAFGAVKGAIAGIGAAFAAREFAQFAGEAMQMAVAAEEVDSKFQAVYGTTGDLAEALSTWADMAGITDTAARDMAATFGNLAMAQGISSEDTKALALDVATLAGDMASFNDADPEQVFNDLNKALLTTEREGMKKYGIAIGEAEVKTRALEIATADGRTEVTQADRALASYEIAVKQAGKAVGDLELTQDSAANKQRQLNASLKEMKEGFGRPLLRAVNDFTSEIQTNGLALDDLGESAGNALVAIESGTGILEAAATVTDENSSMVDKFKASWNGFMEIGPGIVLQIAGIDEKLKFQTDSAEDATLATADLNTALYGTAGPAYDAGRAIDDVGDSIDDLNTSMSRTPQGWNPFADLPNQVWVDPRIPRLGTTSNVVGTPGVIGGRAAGGPVQAGRSYRVGETGPEVFTPSRGGTVHSGAGGVNINVTFSGIVGDPVEVAGQIQDLIELYGRTNGL